MTAAVVASGPILQAIGPDAKPWMLRRLCDRGVIRPAGRVGQYRVYTLDQVGEIRRAMEAAGYLSRPQEAAHVAG